MGLRGRDRIGAERQNESRPLVPRLPLIHVVRAEEVPTLPGHNLEN